MILIKHDTGSYRTTTWAWWSEEGHNRLRFSPSFYSESEAYEWHDTIVDSILSELYYRNKKVSVAENETRDNGSSNAGPKKLHADGKDSS